MALLRSSALSALFVTLIGCAGGASGPGPGTSVEDGCPGYQGSGGTAAQEAVDRLGCYRALMGLTPAVQVPTLSAAAEAHARYMAATDDFSHDEADPDHPAFTGAGPGERAAAQGFVTDGAVEGVHEVIAFHDAGADPAASLDTWMRTIYHREPLTTPGPVEVGFGSAGIYSVMLVVLSWEAEGALEVGLYPADGQGAVGRTFDSDTETPDPLPQHGVVGLPITATVLDRGWQDGNDPYGLVIDRAASSLRDAASGAEHEVLFFEPRSEPHLLRTIALIPRTPLPGERTWEVSLSFESGGAERSVRWAFATGP